MKKISRPDEWRKKQIGGPCADVAAIQLTTSGEKTEERDVSRTLCDNMNVRGPRQLGDKEKSGSTLISRHGAASRADNAHGGACGGWKNAPDNNSLPCVTSKARDRKTGGARARGNGVENVAGGGGIY